MKCYGSVLLIGLLAVPVAAGAPDAPPAAQTQDPSSDDLYKLGKSLFDTYAPSEIKEQYEFPSKEQWDEFATRLQHALDSGSFEELAGYEAEARAAQAAVQALPDHADYADWLAERLDYIEASKQVVRQPSQPTPAPRPAISGIPYYDLWLTRMHARPKPARADELMPVLKAAFKAEGVPAELAWVAETESTLNPNARSPAGARGLFQLMPDTAKALGLSTFLPDERTDPEKSARAAARQLRGLYERFGSWPLALAAYNGGERRLNKALANRPGATFADLASSLPVETRMYVPKVLATVAVRENTTPRFAL